MKNDSTAPIRPALRSSASEPRMLSAWFATTRISMPCSCGSSRAASTAAMTRSATSTTLACVDLYTSMPTAGRPSMWRPIVSSGATSSTAATSPTRTPPPIIRLRTSSSVWNSPSGRTMKREPFSVISPALTEKFDDSSSCAQLQHVDAVGSDPGWIDQHAHLARLDTLELDTCDAVEALDRVLEVFLQRVVLVGEIGVGGEPDDHHRLVRSAEGEHQDAIGRRRELRPDRVELGAHLERGLLGVAVPVEEHRELRLVRARGGLDLLDAGQRRERLLDRPHDELLHFLGCRPGVGDGHLHSREGDVREVLEPQQLHGDQPDCEHGQEHHDGADRAVEREAGVTHGNLSPWRVPGRRCPTAAGAA